MALSLCRWSAQAALDFVKSRRSLVAPNDGWVCLWQAGLVHVAPGRIALDPAACGSGSSERCLVFMLVDAATRLLPCSAYTLAPLRAVVPSPTASLSVRRQSLPLHSCAHPPAAGSGARCAGWRRAWASRSGEGLRWWRCSVTGHAETCISPYSSATACAAGRAGPLCVCLRLT